MIRTLIMTLAIASLTSAAAVAVPATPPQPVPTEAPMGYYIMQGKTIVSQPFPDVNTCFKTLQKIQKTVAPGNDTLVCAHRHP
jgi:hypothetical protein